MNLFVAFTSSLIIPFSIAECPESAIIFNSASGNALCKSHADLIGHTTSYLP